MPIKDVMIGLKHSAERSFIFQFRMKADICIEDIAHGLAHTCRYSGQCGQFYFSRGTLAFYCQDTSRRRIDRVNIRRELLMHDATEAYLTDISRPLKKCLPDYQKIEGELN